MFYTFEIQLAQRSLDNRGPTGFSLPETLGMYLFAVIPRVETESLVHIL